MIPTRDRPDLLKVCLDSLLRQELDGQVEIVVVDDGVGEETRDLTLALQQEADPRFTVLYEHQGGLGINAARNRGVWSSKGDLICLVDDDIEAPVHWLATLVNGVREHARADVVGGPILLRLEGPEPRHCRGHRLPETHLDLGPGVVWDTKLFGANLAFRRSAFERVGPFSDAMIWRGGNEEEWEDRLLQQGGHILYIPEAWLWHRRTAHDLRPVHLLRRAYRSGYGQVYYRLGRGDAVALPAELTLVVRGLGHAARFRCFYGVLRAWRHLGAARRLWEIRG